MLRFFTGVLVQNAISYYTECICHQTPRFNGSVKTCPTRIAFSTLLFIRAREPSDDSCTSRTTIAKQLPTTVHHRGFVKFPAPSLPLALLLSSFKNCLIQCLSGPNSPRTFLFHLYLLCIKSISSFKQNRNCGSVILTFPHSY